MALAKEDTGSIRIVYCGFLTCYDPLNRLTGGALGTMTFGDSAHLHGATSSSGGETASYDAAGEMICRAPTAATTCSGASPTGALLVYDAERRLKYWQNGQNGQPITSQVWFMYDGEGHRVEQYTSGGSGNHTYYLPGNVEEVTPSGTLVKYYNAGGLALGVNTTTNSSGISYLVSDGLGSVSEALNQTGSASGTQLYSPYGTVRYSSGVMPTSKGFTGQYSDAGSTGLDYYGARYYDPSLGQFTSADTVTDGLNRYGYVKGNPETYTDPSGHRVCYGDNASTCVVAPPPSTSSGCRSDGSCGCYASCGGHRGSGPDPYDRPDRKFTHCADASCDVRFGDAPNPGYRGPLSSRDSHADALRGYGASGKKVLMTMLQQVQKEVDAMIDARIAQLEKEIYELEHLDTVDSDLSRAIKGLPSPWYGKALLTAALVIGKLSILADKAEINNLMRAKSQFDQSLNSALTYIDQADVRESSYITVYFTHLPRIDANNNINLYPFGVQTVENY